MPSLNKFAALTLQRVAGSAVAARYRELSALFGRGKLGRVHLEGLVEARLQSLLTHAASNVPFYRERVPPRPNLCLEDFPVLTKADLQARFQELMTPAVAASYRRGRSRRYGWVVVSTGGSTGQPVSVLHDADMRDRGRALRLYAQDLCGFSFGTPYLKLWGSMPDLRSERASLTARILARLARSYPANAFRMSETDMKRIVGVLKAEKLSHMMAYVDAAHLLARLVIDERIDAPKLTSIMACAGTVTPAVIRDLETAFGARVHNKYGSRECTEMACQCADGAIHEHSSHVFLETVDDAGKCVPPGDSGRVLVTVLWNESFPLIRYDIGDMGALSADWCDCGYPTRLLSRIEGRLVEQLTAEDGAHVSPAFIIHLIGVEHRRLGVRRFQLVQQGRGRFDLLVVLPSTIPTTTLGPILDDLRKGLGSRSDIRVLRVPEIPTTPSGKYLYTINNDRTADKPRAPRASRVMNGI